MTVYPDGMTEDDKTTYIAGLRDVMDLDVVVVAASGNISVSSCFLRPATMIDASYHLTHD